LKGGEEVDFARRLKALIKEGDKLQKEIAKDLNIPETTFRGGGSILLALGDVC